MSGQRDYTIETLVNHVAEKLPAELCDINPDVTISSMATLQLAQPGQLSFLANPSYRKYLADCQASVVILHPNEVEHFSGGKIICPQPYIAFALLTELFRKAHAAEAGVHPSASVNCSAQVASSASIGPNCVVEAGAQIGERARLMAGAYIGAEAIVGDDSVIHPNVSLGQGVRLGQRVEIHPNAVIGSEGFGFAQTPEGWLKVHQLGSVEIGNDAEIGASTTIDRGALDNTVIGNGVKIDNQVQIAHNVQIGDNTAIAACVGISGSAIIGRNCTLAGGVGLVGHIELADNVHITGMTMVTKSIGEAGSYSSGTPMMATDKWRRSAVRFSQLDTMASGLRKLQKGQPKD
ncbi:MAG: UDP-3-O-(3-hydroxymyristoyl)glucosamine N-acyltransferase [Cellvibrionaceae bacterium]|nr:UDP-3-O-(3-hydroxymyristoyl)glucosamine N-acyltransferase [Cellvibrionaceae bacterium]